MSRIGSQIIKVPSGVKVFEKDGMYHVEGPKGKLCTKIPKGISVELKDGVIQVHRDDSVEGASALHGLIRTLINNNVHGVSEGFSKTLEINGVGYRAQVQGTNVNLTLGFSHPLAHPLPTGVTAKVEKNTVLTITGSDKEVVGQVAAEIRAYRPVEPYQGKGIRYQGERVIRKAGKAAGKTA